MLNATNDFQPSTCLRTCPQARSQRIRLLLMPTIIALAMALSPAVGAAGKSHRGRSTASTPDKKEQTIKPQQATEANIQVWIGKNDAATSCNVNSGVSIDAMNQELKKAGIKIYEKKKIHDAQLRIAMCGVDKGTMNGFLIAKKDLAKALALGFKELP